MSSRYMIHVFFLKVIELTFHTELLAVGSLAPQQFRGLGTAVLLHGSNALPQHKTGGNTHC